MSRSYTLDAEQAKQAGVSNRITETGKYVGRFTRAEAVKSRQNTEGVEFAFESKDGQTADFLTCWTYNENGEPLYGLKVLNAVMTCMRVKTLAPQSMQFTAYDGSKRIADGFVELMNQPIGLLLQREEYEKRDGTVGHKFNIALPFDAVSELTAGEILSRITQPTALAKAAANLRDKPLAKRRETAQYASSGHPANQSSSVADIDDDIPF